MKKTLIALSLLVAGPALAQWQVPVNTIPVGRGAGVSGFNSVANTGTGILCLLNTAPPTFGTCTVTPAAGSTTQFQYNNAGAFAGSTVLTQQNVASIPFVGIGDNIADGISRWPGVKMPLILSDRTVNWAPISDNTYADLTTLSPINSTSNAYASYSSRLYSTSTFNFDHWAGFEDLPIYSGSGTITNQFSFLSNPVYNSGTITNRYGLNIKEVIGAGAITNDYGIYVAPLTKGATKNWGIYVDGVEPSFFGGNVLANNFISAGFTAASTGGTTTLTSASPRFQQITGTLNQTTKLPVATTLTVAAEFDFDNNSTGVWTIQDAGANTLITIPSGGIVQMRLSDASTSNGVWDRHSMLPDNAYWGSAGLAINSGATQIAPDAIITINGNTGSTVATDAVSQIHMVAPNATTAGIYTDAFGASNIFATRMAGGTLASKTAVTANQVPFIISSYTWDGSSYNANGAIDFFTGTSTQSGTDHGGGVKFLTTPNASVSLTEAGRFQPSGGLSVGTTTDPGQGKISANAGFVSGGSAGLSVTKTVRASGGASDCTLIFTGGLLTGGSC